MDTEKNKLEADKAIGRSLVKKQGFAIGLILGVLALIGLIATAISLSVSNSSTNTDGQKDQSHASVILEQSNNLAMTASFMMAQSPTTTSASLLTVDNDPNTGIYGKGGLGTMNPRGIGGVTSTSWGNTASADVLYADKSFTGTATSDYYVAVDGVTVAVCNEINNALNLNNTTVLTAQDDPVEADFTDAGYQTGCFLTATGASTGKFFRVIQAK